MQRWCLFLGACSYAIQFRCTGEHADCDGLSRLACAEGPASSELADRGEVFALSQVQSGPVTAKCVAVESVHDPSHGRVVQAIAQHVAVESAHDPVRARVVQAIVQRVAVESAHDPVRARVMQAIVQHVIASSAGCIDEEAMQKRRQERFISMLSAFHPTTELWLFTRLLWWPWLNEGIEQVIKHCATCQADAENMAWQRVRVDFACPVPG